MTEGREGFNSPAVLRNFLAGDAGFKRARKVLHKTASKRDSSMAEIGPFTLKDGTWTRTIRTMTINAKAQLVSAKDKAKGAPDLRL